MIYVIRLSHLKFPAKNIVAQITEENNQPLFKLQKELKKEDDQRIYVLHADIIPRATVSGSFVIFVLERNIMI